MSTVGLNQWRGGYKKYSHQNGEYLGSFEPLTIEPDSYLGENITIEFKCDAVYQQCSNQLMLFVNQGK